ncbi:hypothetical protein TNCV_3857711 [Trichonephila clavipes]|nr:hypothetical protein TNCV_3857711 [Trichonephila clavipes]
MKTSSVEFISRSPNPLPMKSEHRRFVLLRRIFQPWQWKRRKREIVLNRRPELYRGKYRCVQPKINLLKKDVLMPVKHNVFLWNLPDIEEVPSHDGETILLWSPWKYRCGQRTVRLAVVACSQNQSQAVFARRRSKQKLKLELVEEKQKLLDIRERKGERERCASRRYLLNIIQTKLGGITDPIIKQQNSEQKHPSSPTPKKAETVKLAGEACLKGILSPRPVSREWDNRNRWRDGQVCPDVGQGIMAPGTRRPRWGEKWKSLQGKLTDGTVVEVEAGASFYTDPSSDARQMHMNVAKCSN